MRRDYFDVYGRVISLQSFPRHKSGGASGRSDLFVLTERDRFFVLGYDERGKRFVTKAEGDATDRVGRPVQSGTKCAIDPKGRVVGLHIYDGMVKMLPILSGTSKSRGHRERNARVGTHLSTAYNTRIDELQVIDMTFLHTSGSKPKICVLFREMPMGQDNGANDVVARDYCVFIKTYTLDLDAKELTRDHPSTKLRTRSNAKRVVAVPFGGVMVVSDAFVEYFSLGMAPSDLTGTTSSSTSSPGNDNTTSPTVDLTTISPVTPSSRHAAGSGRRREHYTERPLGSTSICAIGAIDDVRDARRKGQMRYLFSDVRGSLTIVVISENPRQILTQVVGTTSIASSISYLDSGIVYIGSAMGDSQLIKLSDETFENGSNVRVLDTFTNLGPILDMTAIDLERHGQCKLVTCSGAYGNGSLRVVSNGIGFNVQAGIDLPGVNGMWALRRHFDDTHDRMLVQTFVGETRILGIDDEAEMGEVRIDSFDASAQTLYCGNARGDHIVQVTAQGARLIRCADGHELVDRWDAASGDHDDDAPKHHVVVATGTSSQIVMALNGGVLVYVEIAASDEGSKRFELREVKRKTFEHEIACIDASPMHVPSSNEDSNEDSNEESKTIAPEAATKIADTAMDVESSGEKGNDVWRRHHDRAAFVAVSLWTDIDVRILDLPSLQQRHREKLRGHVLPRSLLLTVMESAPYLLVGLADGHLESFRFDTSTGSLRDRKRVLLGRNPIVLRPFRVSDKSHVFACCDRPMVLYGKKGTITFVNVNMSDEVTFMTPFNSEDFPDCLALSSETMLNIGEIDNIQKLHVETLHLDAAPRRIAYQQSTRTICVCTEKRTSRTSSANSGSGVVRRRRATASSIEEEHFCYVRIYSTESNRLRKIGSHQLDPFESPFSVCSTTFQGDSRQYFVVGTAYLLADEDEPSKGRIMVFAVRTDLRQQDEEEEDEEGATSNMDVEEINQLVLVHEVACDGCPYSMASYQGRIVVGVNAHVNMYEWRRAGIGLRGIRPEDNAAATDDDGNDARRRLEMICTSPGHFVSLLVRCYGDYVAVGDLMKSVRLLQFDRSTQQLIEVARDSQCNWMCALACLPKSESDAHNTFVGAEDSYNLFTLRTNTTARTEEEKARLVVSGEYHLGESVNKFCHGALVMQPPSSDKENGTNDTSKNVSTTRPALMFGTVSGMIGVIVSLTREDFAVLKCLQDAMTKVVHGIGGLKHHHWRSFSNDYRKKPKVSTGFIDGDLVETLLDPEVSRRDVVAAMNEQTKGSVTYDEASVVALIEKLSRMH